MVMFASLTAGLLMMGLFRQTTTAQIGRAEAVIARSCDAIGRDYRFYMTGWPGSAPRLDDAQLKQGMANVLQAALRDQAGVEGGIWQAEAGSLAYAYPTYEGSGPKSDLPQAELAQIRDINTKAARDDYGKFLRVKGRSQTLLLYACPLNGVIPALTAWTMTRVGTATGQGYFKLRLGLGVLLACVVAAAALLTWLLVSWSRHIARIESALSGHGEADLPALPTTGERDLDRIVLALNRAGARLTEARRHSEVMSRRIAGAERLAAIGRMAAAFAHEIRNPIAAMRLRAENALASDDDRRRAALDVILAQISRLDRLVEQLLTASHRQTPNLSRVDVREFLASVIAVHSETAAPRGIQLKAQTDLATASIDREMMTRALDNLVGNAMQHVPDAGQILVTAGRQDGRLTFTVSDTGPGVPAALRDTLFEPFVTGRADGTGLGLSIVREVAESHGGHVELAPSAAGACFVISLPVTGESQCQPS
jgi:signal transduction histidine kinase